MARKKLKLAFIENDSKRKASYKRRKKGLMKTIQELSTLCGIDACVILYGPLHDKPEVWPSNPNVMNHVLAKFKTLSEVEKVRWTVNQEGFTRNIIDKKNKQLKQLRKDNRVMEINNLVNKCLTGAQSVKNLGLLDIEDMKWLIERNLKEITRRIANLKKNTSDGELLDLNLVPTEISIDVNGRRIGGGLDDGSSSSVAFAPQIPMVESHHQMQNLP